MQTKEQITAAKDLLDAWATLEPDRCLIIDQLSFNLLQSGHFNIVWLLDRISAFSGNILQGAVQEAIGSHGLLFCIQNSVGGEFYAEIQKADGFIGWNMFQSWHGRADDIAIALLIAYLDFLKSEDIQDA